MIWTLVNIRNVIPQVKPNYRHRLTIVMAAYQQEPNQAQDVVRCKICENDDHVEYFMYCKNCGDNMCPQCNEKHKEHFTNHVILRTMRDNSLGNAAWNIPLNFTMPDVKTAIYQYALNAKYNIISHIKIQVLRTCVNLQEKKWRRI